MSEDHLWDLGRHTALQHLRRVSVGRLATSHGALPLVVPVNFTLWRDDLVFAVERDSPLARALDGGVFAFEASGHDEQTERWWSVIVRGQASLAEDSHPARSDIAELGLEVPCQAVLGSSSLVRGAEVASLLALPALSAHLTRPAAPPTNAASD